MYFCVKTPLFSPMCVCVFLKKILKKKKKRLASSYHHTMLRRIILKEHYDDLKTILFDDTLR